MIRRSFAIAGVVSATAVMWLDAAVDWWRWIVEFVLGTRVDEFETARGRFGDADLHALVWGAVALALLLAVSNAHWWKWLVGLASWSIIVEVMQPVFATIRQRQAIDVLGNLVGVGLVAVVALILHGRRGRRITV